jgi:hypothetical protein
MRARAHAPPQGQAAGLSSAARACRALHALASSAARACRALRALVGACRALHALPSVEPPSSTPPPPPPTPGISLLSRLSGSLVSLGAGDTLDSIRFDSIRFDSIRFDSRGPSAQQGIPQAFLKAHSSRRTPQGALPHSSRRTPQGALGPRVLRPCWHPSSLTTSSGTSLA